MSEGSYRVSNLSKAAALPLWSRYLTRVETVSDGMTYSPEDCVLVALVDGVRVPLAATSNPPKTMTVTKAGGEASDTD
jgi:hypothetical protein